MKNPRKKKPATHSPRTDTQVSVGWSGPLPPPAALQQFDATIENGAERILKMAETEQAARLAREAEAIKYELAKFEAIRQDNRRGQWLGFIIALSAVAAASITAYFGAHPSVSIALVGVPILGIVKAIINSRSDR
ncbi:MULTISPECIES: DUF2335 domain-containing protein [Methylomonas]|uniref:Uncharacterized protein n=1 Tax=Methylomonas koyamae TaxID=702114 RepID=A0A291IH04_9GAMM|nr:MULTISPECIES: DUF2335 domain-containing protein [Methylomonas]ANE54778.1 hypothetical protein AYM39_05995 [Methylomonas sp. DH-1]ATG89478.1 hypothetical protein MKLM6_1221 [Methylomonas koyamae]OAI22792.1 hypothetical protein A1356_18835 [Methylomonas koyamae]